LKSEKKELTNQSYIDLFKMDDFPAENVLVTQLSKRKASTNEETVKEKKKRRLTSALSPSAFPTPTPPFPLPSSLPSKEDFLTARKKAKEIVRETLAYYLSEVESLQEDASLGDAPMIDESSTTPSNASSFISLIKSTLNSLDSICENYRRKQTRSMDVRLHEEALAQSQDESPGSFDTLVPPFFEHARILGRSRPSPNQISVSLQRLLAMNISPKDALGVIKRSLNRMGEIPAPVQGHLTKQLKKMNEEQPALLVAIAEGFSKSLQDGGLLSSHANLSLATKQVKDLFEKGKRLALIHKAELEKLSGVTHQDKVKAFSSEHYDGLFEAKRAAVNLVEAMSHVYAALGARLLVDMLDDKGKPHPLAVFFTEVTKADSSLSGVLKKLGTAITVTEAPKVITKLKQSPFQAALGIPIDVLRDVGGYDSFFAFEAFRYDGYPLDESNTLRFNLPRLQRCKIVKESSKSGATNEEYKVINIGHYINNSDQWQQYPCCLGRLVETLCAAPGKGTGHSSIVMRVKGSHFKNMLMFEHSLTLEMPVTCNRFKNLGLTSSKSRAISLSSSSSSSTLSSSSSNMQDISSSLPLLSTSARPSLAPPFSLPSSLPSKEDFLTARKKAKEIVRETLAYYLSEVESLQEDASLGDAPMIDESSTTPSNASSFISLIKSTLNSLDSICENYRRKQTRSMDVRLHEEALAQSQDESPGSFDTLVPPFFEHARILGRSRPSPNQISVSLQRLLAMNISPKDALGVIKRSLNRMGEIPAPVQGHLTKQLKKMNEEQPALLVAIAEGFSKSLQDGGLLSSHANLSLATKQVKDLFEKGKRLALIHKAELEKLSGVTHQDKVKAFIGQHKKEEKKINLEVARDAVRNAVKTSNNDAIKKVLSRFDSSVTVENLYQFIKEVEPFGVDSSVYHAMQRIYCSTDYILQGTKAYLLEKSLIKATIDPSDHILKAHLEQAASIAPKEIVDINDVISVITNVCAVSPKTDILRVLTWYSDEMKMGSLKNFLHSMKAFFKTRIPPSMNTIVGRAFQSIFNACGSDINKTEEYLMAKSKDENSKGGPELEAHRHRPDASHIEQKLVLSEAKKILKKLEENSSRDDVVRVLKPFNDNVTYVVVKNFQKEDNKKGSPAYIALQAIYRLTNYNHDAFVSYLDMKSKEEEVPDANDQILNKHLAIGNPTAARLAAVNLVEAMSHVYAALGARLLVDMLDDKGKPHPLAVFFTEVTKADSSLSGVLKKLGTAITVTEASKVIEILKQSPCQAAIGIPIDVLRDVGGYDSFYTFEAFQYDGYPRGLANRQSKNIPRLQRSNIVTTSSISSKTNERYKKIKIGHHINNNGKWLQYPCCLGRLVETLCAAPGKGTGHASIVMRVKGQHFKNMLMFEHALILEMMMMMMMRRDN
jgi:uncharacterized protein YcbK (DUF882 family)